MFKTYQHVLVDIHVSYAHMLHVKSQKVSNVEFPNVCKVIPLPVVTTNNVCS